MQRPVIHEYENLLKFVRDALRFRRENEPQFSVHAAAKTLRKVSPTLVSLVLAEKRKLTLDRADEFARLLNLNITEKTYFKKWIERIEAGEAQPDTPHVSHIQAQTKRRKDVSVHLLNDWLNVYVKDLFQIEAVQASPDLLQQTLSFIASPARIRRSLEFLLREGYLRRTLNGKIEPETNLAVHDPKIASTKIRQFHKAALSIAKAAIDLVPPTERRANTLTIPLNSKSREKLEALLEEFSEKLKEFAAENDEPGDQLYQLIVNLSPIGGKLK